MHIHELSLTNSVLNNFISEIRGINEQRDAMRFRRNIERIGELLSYEMSKTLNYQVKTIETPLGKKEVNVLQDNVVICSILRAGLPLHLGVLNYFDKAESAFISAYRKHKSNGVDFRIEVEYVACPSLENKTLVLVDPMLATGQSLVLTYQALLKYGNPKQVHLVSVIAAKPGIEFITDRFPKETHLWVAQADPELNDRGYIVPGLGDAGDLAFGSKLQN